jgi:hypothetical protein
VLVSAVIPGPSGNSYFEYSPHYIAGGRRPLRIFDFRTSQCSKASKEGLIAGDLRAVKEVVATDILTPTTTSCQLDRYQ